MRVITLQEMRNISLDFIFLHAMKLITVLFHFRIEVGITEEEKCIDWGKGVNSIQNYKRF